MAWLKETSIFAFGKYKGKKVSDIKDSAYVEWLHKSKLNVYFVKEVLERLNIKTNDRRTN